MPIMVVTVGGDHDEALVLEFVLYSYNVNILLYTYSVFVSFAVILNTIMLKSVLRLDIQL